MGITILTIYDRIACFHSLKPFLFAEDSRRFTITDSADYCLQKDRNTTLILMRQFIKPDRVDIELLKKLRAKYRRIAFFHDDAGGGIPRLEVLPYVDLFYTKALFTDRSLYGKSLYGKELYSNYYHEKFGITDSDHRERAVETRSEELGKLRLSWNIGVGDYPREQFRQRAGVALTRTFGITCAKLLYTRKKPPVDPVALNKGLYPVNARIDLAARPSIAYQRKLILEKIEGNPDFLTGMVPQAQFNDEVAHSRITLSPFGWGELCLRDFEAVLAGSLLLKPDMSHIETWPDIFKPGETYAPFSWDADDLASVARDYLSNEEKRSRIAREAFRQYQDQLKNLPARFKGIIAEIEG